MEYVGLNPLEASAKTGELFSVVPFWLQASDPPHHCLFFEVLYQTGMLFHGGFEAAVGGRKEVVFCWQKSLLF